MHYLRGGSGLQGFGQHSSTDSHSGSGGEHDFCFGQGFGQYLGFLQHSQASSLQHPVGC